MFREEGLCRLTAAMLEDEPVMLYATVYWFITNTHMSITPNSGGSSMDVAPGTVFTNQELVARFRVGNMGGMRRSTALNCLLLISDPFKALYEDKWHDEILHYTGMGKKGDQDFIKQNRTLRDSKQLGVTVYLFEVFQPQQYTLMGEVELAGDIYTEIQPDDDGAPRRVLMFPLKVVDSTLPDLEKDVIIQKEQILASAARRRSLSDLKRRARIAKGIPGTRTTTSTQFERNQDVVEYVLRAAGGDCQLCDHPAPFSRPSGEPFLEVHHVVWLARGGEDSVANAVALCPNCHRKMHIVDDQRDVTRLREVAARGAAALMVGSDGAN